MRHVLIKSPCSARIPRVLLLLPCKSIGRCVLAYLDFTRPFSRFFVYISWSPPTILSLSLSPSRNIVGFTSNRYLFPRCTFGIVVFTKGNGSSTVTLFWIRDIRPAITPGINLNAYSKYLNLIDKIRAFLFRALLYFRANSTNSSNFEWWNFLQSRIFPKTAFTERILFFVRREKKDRNGISEGRRGFDRSMRLNS